jgi:hypothetical protein
MPPCAPQTPRRVQASRGRNDPRMPYGPPPRRQRPHLVRGTLLRIPDLRSRHANIRQAAHRPAPPGRVVATHPAHHPIRPPEHSQPRRHIIRSWLPASRTPPASLRDRLRRSLTRPSIRGPWRLSGAGSRPTCAQNDPQTTRNRQTTAMPYPPLTEPFHIRAVVGPVGPGGQVRSGREVRGSVRGFR